MADRKMAHRKVTHDDSSHSRIQKASINHLSAGQEGLHIEHVQVGALHAYPRNARSTVLSRSSRSPPASRPLGSLIPYSLIKTI